MNELLGGYFDIIAYVAPPVVVILFAIVFFFSAFRALSRLHAVETASGDDDNAQK